MDTETTGLDSKTQEIIEFACIVDINGKEVDRKTWEIRPELWDNISPEALKVNKRTIPELKKFQLTQKQFLIEFIKFIKDYVDMNDKWDYFVIGAHNASFDKDMLYETFCRYGIQKRWDTIFRHQLIDTSVFPIFTHYMDKDQYNCHYSLKQTAQQFEVPFDKKKAHGAMYDTEVCRRLFRKSIGVDDD
jgi:DNA polymerase III alpha subunit (gram-positive type)